MRKKITAFIIVIVIIAAGIISWKMNTYSASGKPYSKPQSCLEATANEIYLMRAGWNQILKTITDREKPRSEIVDEAYESMSTYRCWLDYLCETVLLSGNLNAKAVAAGLVKKNDIKTIFGCVAPENIKIPTTKLQYIPECKVSSSVAGTMLLQEATQNYQTCRQMVALEFADKVTDKTTQSISKYMETIKNTSSAYIGLETLLKSSSAAQKNRVLQKKLSDILTGLNAMESHMDYMVQFMNRFDSLMPCTIGKCD